MNEIEGSLIAWTIATLSVLVSAGWAYRQKEEIHPSALPALDFVSALVLTYIALDIFRPVPFLSEPICTLFTSPLEPFKTICEETKISYAILLFALLACVWFLRIRKKRPRAKKRSLETPVGVAWKNFALMTLLPIVVQYWVIIASTERLITYGGILAIGLFILAGPASWQFVMRIMLLSKKEKKKKKVLGILAVMSISLGGILGATFFGIQLKSDPTLVDPLILRHVAGFTMIAIPYFFFYSYWGERWSENRPIAVILAMVCIALYSSIQITNELQVFVITVILWAFLLTMPYIFYSDESFMKEYSCPKCEKDGKGSKIRIFKADRICMKHSDLQYEESKVEERRSVFSMLYMLLFERFRSRPWGDEMIVTLNPDKDEYSVGEQVTVDLIVRNNDNRVLRLGIEHPVHCKILAYWVVNKHRHEIGFPESKWIEPGKEIYFSYDAKIPLPPRAPLPKKSNLLLEVTATFFEIRPPRYFDKPVTMPFKRKIRLKRKVEAFAQE